MNNCLAWALPRWLRNYLRGEALIIRKSKYSVFPHIMRAPCIKGTKVIEYVPLKPVTKALPVYAILFRGEVRQGRATCVCERCKEES